MTKSHLPGQPVTSSSGSKKIQWHPPFCAAMRLELIKYKEKLNYYMEYALNTKPLLIDLLVIKKDKNAEIDNDIGRTFKTYNILEYKSPNAKLNIDDFSKTIGYAMFYKAIGEKVDSIDSFDITVTFVRARRPRKLMKILRKKYGLIVEKRAKGIYTVNAHYLGGVQIVVSKELNPREHIWLTSLDDQMREEDARKLLEEAGNLKDKDDREYADSVLQIAMVKNKDIFRNGKERDDMCQAFWELFEPEITEEILKGEKRGEECGESRRLISQIMKKIQRGKDIFSIADAVEEPVEVIRPIYEAVLAAPGADVGQIYEKVYLT